MKYGFVRVGAFTPVIKVGNPEYNGKAIIEMIKCAAAFGVEILALPELCVCGYTCADLFFTRELLSETEKAVKNIAANTPEGIIVFVGAPVVHGGRLYNCAIALSGGKVLGIVPKTELPNYGEFYEKRYFSPAFDGVQTCENYGAPMGNVLFGCAGTDLVIGCEICEDMWTDIPPSVHACRAGANVIVNLSASDEVVGKAEYRKLLIKSLSGRLNCAYVYADAGAGESTTDMVFAAHNMVAENGAVIAESAPFAGGEAVTEIDIQRLIVDRLKMGVKPTDKKFTVVPFELSKSNADIKLLRKIEKYPFVPSGDSTSSRAELILTMQAAGLKKRVKATKCDTLVLGLSGGLDSALALLVCCRAADRSKIKAITMPCFGTTQKTLGNAEKLAAALGVSLETIDIKNTVNSHLKDIDHDKTDVVYENAQARVRTMTLFDIANKTNGLVVGTGDLSELALGWCTYNGDHMSSYCVNGGVPKTLVKHLVSYEAKRLGGEVAAAINDILNTDISPELLPTDNGKIAQKTEDILGKYDLLDFIMYYYCRYGFTRDKIEFLLKSAFDGTPASQIKKALDTFFKRFFMSQFKRSCMPDGVKIGSVSFSPRSDFRLPSDIEKN